MSEQRRLSDEAQRWLDGEVGASVPESERREAERLQATGAAYAKSLDLPGAELDIAVMTTIRNRASARPAPRRSVWRWLVEPWTVRVRPAYALGAAFLVALVVFATRGGIGLAPDARLAAVPPGQVLVRFELTAPEAGRVSLAGTFNEWNADAVALDLNPVTGVWSVSVPVEPGEHQYLFVVDGERWIPDPEAYAQIDDGFGQTNSVLLVSPGGARS